MRNCCEGGDPLALMLADPCNELTIDFILTLDMILLRT